MEKEITIEWSKAQKWEADWHGNCVNSYNEETKQFVYAKYMGLKKKPNTKTPYVFDMQNKSILDLGGGPYSLLLKCENFSQATVIDPIEYPQWVIDRYASANIEYIRVPAENINFYPNPIIYDEVWLYNVLQHTISPQNIIENALDLGKIVRIFEWIENGISEGHLHNLKKENLDKWLNGFGQAKQLNESGCVGLAYFGIFPGKHYKKV